MKFTSTFALAAVIATGLTSTVATTPAAAQKKGKKDEEGGLKLSEGVRNPVAAAQAALKAGDTATANAQLAIAAPLAQSDDEKYAVNALKLQIAAPSNDPAQLIPILDVLVANPRTPPTALPQYNYFRGALPYQQKKYAEALPFLLKARDLGYKNDNLTLQIAQAMVETGNVTGGIGELDKAIAAETAAGRKAPEAWYDYGVAKAYGAKDATLLNTWLQRQITAYPSPKNWRKALLVYREKMEKGGVKLDRGQQLDLFRLMRTTKALADRGDYLEYADIAYYAGLPGEAKAVLEEGRTTGKVTADNTNANKLLADSKAAIAKEGSLASVEAKARTAANGKTAAQTADAYFGLGQTAKAIELYQLALQKGGVDNDEVNLHLGAALAQAGQKDQARAALQKVAAGPRKEIAGYWIQYLDIGAAAPGAAVAGQ